MTRRVALALFAAFSLARALLLPAFDLMPQSAYYFTAYAEHPALSYYDHPPLIGWLLWAAAALFGKSALAVRGAVFATTLATQIAFYALGRRLLGERAAGRALVFLTASGVALLTSFIATPDVPLLLCWTLSLLALERALFADDGRRALLRWTLAGAAMGLAFLSKYTGVFLQGGLVLFLLAAPGHRHRLRTPGPWLALAVAQVVSLPVWIWNLRHDFASFAFQLGGRAAESRFDPDDVLGFLAGQVGVLLPVGFGLFVWIVGRESWRALRALPPSSERASLPERELFLLAFAAPLFATCLALSTMTWVKVNWAMPAYLSGLLLVAPRRRPPEHRLAGGLRRPAPRGGGGAARRLPGAGAEQRHLVGLAGAGRRGGGAGRAPPGPLLLLRRQLQDHRRAALLQRRAGLRHERHRLERPPVRVHRRGPLDARRPRRFPDPGGGEAAPQRPHRALPRAHPALLRARRGGGVDPAVRPGEDGEELVRWFRVFSCESYRGPSPALGMGPEDPPPDAAGSIDDR